MRTVALIFALTLAACATMDVDYHFAPERGSVFPADIAKAQAREIFMGCDRSEPGHIESAFTPSSADVARIDAALPQLLSRDLISRRGSPRIVLSYYRQYAGFVMDGRRIIYVSGLSELFNQNWRGRAFQACDVGDATFGVRYDVETRKFEMLEFGVTLFG